MLSFYLGMRSALLAHEIDSAWVGEYERTSHRFRQWLGFWVIEHTPLTHPRVLESVDITDWDEELDVVSEWVRRTCTAATLFMAVVSVWLIGPWWPFAAAATWICSKRGCAALWAWWVNRRFRMSDWDVDALMSELPEIARRLRFDDMPDVVVEGMSLASPRRGRHVSAVRALTPVREAERLTG